MVLEHTLAAWGKVELRHLACSLTIYFSKKSCRHVQSAQSQSVTLTVAKLANTKSGNRTLHHYDQVQPH